jgi:predicted acyl esterase
MADGTILRADVYRPSAPGCYPVLVERVAYELEGRCRYAVCWLRAPCHAQ